MHVSNLLGALEVVLEDVVADCQLLNLRARRAAAGAAGAAGPEPPGGAAAAAARYARQLSAAFALHQRLFDLARAGAKAGGGKGKKVGRRWGVSWVCGPGACLNQGLLNHPAAAAPTHRHLLV
jgi:hypothetical protein